MGIDKVGYKSVHFVCQLPSNRIKLPEYKRFENLNFEIQIRTILQHSWAEIEHDKNYKFTGELPKEIKRRFKLVAGNLELADREFNLLSREIDLYEQEIKIGTESGKLDIEINSTSLKKYYSTKLDKLISKGLLKPEFGSGGDYLILEELRSFGINKLDELDSKLTKDLIKEIEKTSTGENITGLSRLIMFSSDLNKYMKQSYNGQWSTIHKQHENILTALGVDLTNFKEYLQE